MALVSDPAVTRQVLQRLPLLHCWDIDKLVHILQLRHFDGLLNCRRHLRHRITHFGDLLNKASTSHIHCARIGPVRAYGRHFDNQPLACH